jgi:hypothetical protein
MQLCVAVLLMTQRFATLGALLALPILSAILAFCWSTQVYPTAIVVTLMFLGTIVLVIWDHAKWRGIFASDAATHAPSLAPLEAPITMRLWQLCGIAILAVYLGVCLAMGEVYRPRGATPSDPGFYVFPVIMALPVVTYVLDRRALARSRS